MEEQDRGVSTLFIVPLIQFFVGALLFVSLLYGQRDLVVLTLLLLSLFAGVRLWTRMSLSGLTCLSSLDKMKVFPDEKLTLKIGVENKKFLPVWLQIIVPVRGLMQGSSVDGTVKNECSLLWYQSTRFQWELSARRRGVHDVGPPRLLAGDLFAFFSREKRMKDGHQVIVYPRLVPLKSVALPRRDFFGIPGARSPVQDPIFILGTRDYQHGRPAKYIHWKASARQNKMQEKVLESTQQEKVLLLVDVDPFSKHNAEEKFEQTLEIVASLAVQLDKQGLALGLVTNGAVVGEGAGTLAPARNRQQLPAVLEILARLQMKPREVLLDRLRNGLRLAWGLCCVYFSYEMDSAATTAQEYFRRSRTPVIFFVHRSPSLAKGERYENLTGIHRLEEILFQRAEAP
jgi:uncharacterized protein (DUF58 family)